MKRIIEKLSIDPSGSWDTENHFRAMAAVGDPQRALAILDRLDQVDEHPSLLDGETSK
ncbi:hypothetical protein GCM10027182_15340 [Aquaspirillum soli]|jgi:hypothetical protein